MTTLELPYPPSVNHIYNYTRCGVFLKKEVKAYRFVVRGIVRSLRMHPVRWRLAVVIDLYPPDRRKRDLDNTLKSLLDSLTHAGVIEDDSCIDDLHVRRRERMPPNGKVILNIQLIPEHTRNLPQ